MPSDERPSRPGPGKHWPGCPAALGTVPTKMVVPAVTVHTDVGTAVYFVSPIVEPAVSLDHSGERVSTPTGSPPLFISHCTLLI